MSRHKNYKSTKKTVLQKEKINKEKSCFLKKLPIFSPYLICFILLWWFAAFMYGDVFYRAEQMSLFVFDNTVMKFTLDKDFGILYMIGRFLLLSFRYPILGGFLFAFLLTTSATLTTNLLRLKGYYRIFSFIVPFGMILYLLSKGYNLYFESEPSIIFTLPLIVDIILGLALALTLIFTNTKYTFLYKRPKESSKENYIQHITIVTLLLISCWYVVYPNNNTWITTKMQNKMYENKWDEMINLAKKAHQPDRSVAAYHAIALVQKGQILNKLFEINYQYPTKAMHGWDISMTPETDYYEADCNFYSGLLNCAYHTAMDRKVIDGPNIQNLKRLFLSALLNNEISLAYKYLTIIDKIPFENKFIEKYTPLIENRQLVLQNMTFAKIFNLVPIGDSFEEDYKRPLFLGYNIALLSGRSKEALYNSIAACLYTKLMPETMMRTQPLRGKQIPSYIEQVILIESLKNPELKKGFTISPMTIQTLQSFMSDISKQSKDKKEAYLKLKGKWNNYYPFYYYYQNLPSKEKKEVSNSSKKGVN